jgi:hypothetical protein
MYIKRELVHYHHNQPQGSCFTNLGLDQSSCKRLIHSFTDILFFVYDIRKVPQTSIMLHSIDNQLAEVVIIIGTVEYANLKQLASFNVVAQYAAFLVTSTLVLRQSSLCDQEHADTLGRAFSMLAPQARESTDETGAQLTKNLYMLGVREYYSKYVMLRDPLPVLFQEYATRLTALRTCEWKVPGQGVDDNMGATVTSIADATNKELELLQTKWAGRLREWRQMSMATYTALSADDRLKMDYLLANPTVTELPVSEKLATLETKLGTDRGKLDASLNMRQDAIIMVEAERVPHTRAQENVDKHAKLCEEYAHNLDKLERQFHTAKKAHRESMERLRAWEVVRDATRDTEALSLAALKKTNSFVTTHAENFFMTAAGRTEALKAMDILILPSTHSSNSFDHPWIGTRPPLTANYLKSLNI